jgi:hypothetical protein
MGFNTQEKDLVMRAMSANMALVAMIWTNQLLDRPSHKSPFRMEILEHLGTSKLGGDNWRSMDMQDGPPKVL